jgi:enamine deaminase RidA (YjgF/YER057c/UK114 family)
LCQNHTPLGRPRPSGRIFIQYSLKGERDEHQASRRRPRLSQAVVHGNTVYLAGIVAGDPSADAKGQTEQILKKIDEHLTAVGSHKSRLLSATIYVANMGLYNDMNAAWDAWIDPANTPARATVEARLATPKFLVEIMAGGGDLMTAPAARRFEGKVVLITGAAGGIGRAVATALSRRRGRGSASSTSRPMASVRRSRRWRRRAAPG